jgi:ribonuclease VapC
VSGVAPASDLIIDSSALVGVLLDEAGSGACLNALLLADMKTISALNYFESAIVMEARKGPGGRIALESFCSALDIQPAPFTPAHAQLALDAWMRFGKGRHPAALNLGDCCAYALAQSTGVPLLAVGQDFVRTDVNLAQLDRQPVA